METSNETDVRKIMLSAGRRSGGFHTAYEGKRAKIRMERVKMGMSSQHTFRDNEALDSSNETRPVAFRFSRDSPSILFTFLARSLSLKLKGQFWEWDG